MLNLAPIAIAPNSSWRTSVDRAWRSPIVRRKFETECGFSPLTDAAGERAEQLLSGYAQTYHERFLIWATRHFGLERQAPAAIKEKLAGV